jgi:hypothetical protein
MIPSKFTLEELRGFALLAELPVEALDLLAFRLDKLDASYHHDPTVTHVEIGLDPHLHRFRFNTDPSGPRPIPIETAEHPWHDLAQLLDGAFREAIPGGLKLRYPSNGGPTAPLTFWAVKKITGSQMVTLPGVAKALQRLDKRARKKLQRLHKPAGTNLT